MPTIQQLIRKGRKVFKSKSKSGALDTCPQRRGFVLGFTQQLLKPNSAMRKVAIRLTNGNEVNAYIGGEGHNLQEHSIVLVRGGRVKKISWCKISHCKRSFRYFWCRRKKQRRSKYGSKKPKKVIIKDEKK